MRRVMFLALVATAVLLPAANSAAETAADLAMAQDIGQRIKDSGRLRNYRIGVKYQDGVAWLEGTTVNAAQRDEALRVTREMQGVVHVVNRIEIAGAPTAVQANLDTAFAEAENVANAPLERPLMPPAQAAGYSQRMQAPARSNMPVPAGRMHPNAMRQASYQAPADAMQAYEGPAGGMAGPAGNMAMAPAPMAHVPGGARAASHDNAQMPGYAWPSYASYPNYAAVTYPQQYSPSAWPYIGPFYPYPQVPLAWRKVSLEWDDGWWFLDFSAHNSSH